VTAHATTTISPEILAGGAAAVATALGLDAQPTPIDELPVDEGEAVIAATMDGDIAFRVFLAIADADQLLADPDALAEILLTAAQAMADTDSQLTLTGLEASPDRPDAFVGLFAESNLAAAIGVSIGANHGSPSELGDGGLDALTAPGSAAVYEPVALQGAGHGRNGAPGPLELLNDVEMEVTVELGRTTMPIRELLSLQPGTVVEIDRAAGAPIDVLVNGRRIASGEVVVVDEEFGVRITEIMPTGEPD
jgi:flagellar motor switch protein FliN/FliY